LTPDEPSKSTTNEVTRLVSEMSSGDTRAVDELLPLVYEELRALAVRRLEAERVGHTLQPTALVHEAYIRLVDQTHASYRDRHHFFAVAATAMRRILVDHARGKHRLKRGGDHHQAEIGNAWVSLKDASVDIAALDEALTRLAQQDPRKAQIVELRFFGGLTVDEVAVSLEISPITVKREWAVAKGWLYRELSS
jgi:RNA polymerase sigma factor (TIGR02999 family)